MARDAGRGETHVRIAIRKPITALLAPALFAGCYTYAPIETTAAIPGMEVRTRVSAATAERIASSVGLSEARVLDGVVVDNQAAGGLSLRIPSVPTGTAGAEEGLFQTISINRQDILEMESKKLDQTRTRLAVGAAVVGAVAMVTTATYRTRATGDGPTTEGPPNFIIRILSFHF
jgi:hypothetical protein